LPKGSLIGKDVNNNNVSELLGKGETHTRHIENVDLQTGLGDPMV